MIYYIFSSTFNNKISILISRSLNNFYLHGYLIKQSLIIMLRPSTKHDLNEIFIQLFVTIPSWRIARLGKTESSLIKTWTFDVRRPDWKLPPFMAISGSSLHSIRLCSSEILSSISLLLLLYVRNSSFIFSSRIII